jgi:hypothetical protein
MGNWVDVHLDVLASSPDEINEIERALKEPCAELIAWRAELCGENPQEVAENVKEIVKFEAIRNLGYVHPSVNKARRFKSSWKDRFWGLVWSHTQFVSRDFPNAVFLAQYWDDQLSYGGKRVFHAGDEIRSSRDSNHHAQAQEWVLPNIFAPFKAEYELDLECGSLWGEWLEDMRKELAELTACYGVPAEKVSEQTIGDPVATKSCESTRPMAGGHE